MSVDSMKKTFFIICLLFVLSPLINAQEPEWATLIKQGHELSKERDYCKANTLYKKAIDILMPDIDQPEVQGLIETIQQAVRQNRLFYAQDSINKLAWESSRKGDYELSNKYYEQLIPIFDSLGATRMIAKTYYFMAHNDVSMGIELVQKEHYSEARPYLLRALERDTVGSKSYYLAHHWLGVLCETEAFEIKHGSELERAVVLLEEAEQHFGTEGKRDRVIKAKLEKAKKLVRLNKDNEARSIYNEVAESCNREDSLAFCRAEALNGLGELEKKIGHYKSAIVFFEDAYDIFEKGGEQNATNASTSANNIALLYRYDIGDTLTALVWEKRVEHHRNKESEYVEKLRAKDKGNFIFSKTMKESDILSSINHAMDRHKLYGDIDGRISELTTLIELLEQDIDSPLVYLAKAYDYRGRGLANKNNFADAAIDTRKAIELYNKTGNDGQVSKCGAWYQLAGCLWKCGNGKEALSAADSCVMLTEAYYGSEHLETMEAYNLRSNIAVAFGEKKLSIGSIIRCYSIVKQNIERNFPFLTERERWYYWNQYNVYLKKMPEVAEKMNVFEGTFIDSIYEEQLMSKGLLLATEIALRKVLERDTALKHTFDRIRELRKAAMVSNYQGEIMCAKKEADRLERELGTKADSLHRFIDFLKIGVEDVKKNLPKDAAAVEFVKYVTNDSAKMGALVLSHKQKHVHFIPLQSENEIIKWSIDTSLRARRLLSRLVWGKMEDELKGCNSVYFAPTGCFYNMGIEYLPDYNDSTHLVGERYDLYRLSSTRELTLKNDRGTINRGAVYGGLKYDMDTNQLKRDQLRYPQIKNRGSILGIETVGNDESLGKKMELPGTLREAIVTDSLLKKVNISSALFTDTLGTEASFKALQDMHINWLHIGTHGFYLTEDESKGVRATFFIDDRQETNNLEEDKALTRSGLCLSGSVAALRGDKNIPKGVEDGVLTAMEISQLDFHDMDMVVLSACQTGLGDIGGDGVFGLQRGFKKAGVNSIVMSLWKVNDFATQLLMTIFYDNLLVQKMKKLDALKAAQEYVRNYEMDEADWEKVNRGDNGGLYKAATKGKKVPTKDPTEPKKIIKPLQNPVYWAGFILLDGLD